MARPPRSRDGRYTTKSVHDLRLQELPWRARPDTELHATAQKNLMTFEGKNGFEGYWPVYTGKSFDIWNPDTGIYYAWADPEPVLDWLQSKRLKAGKSRRNSPHREFPIEFLNDKTTLPCFSPRLAFRDVTNRTNQRTIITCLLPPKVFITNKGPYFLWPRGDEKDQAFLLGVLSSIPLDWYARCFVELSVNYFIINSFPIPRPSRDDVRWKRVVELAGRLACPDNRFVRWANSVGVACGTLTQEDKEAMIYELDAVVAHLYGLNQTQVIHIFETFHKGWKYQERLHGVLQYFRAWR